MKFEIIFFFDPFVASLLFTGGATESPLPLHTTFAAGATPPISGAPALPTLSIAVANYPALDKIPPTDSAEVAEWMKELEGHEIPTFSATIDGSCGSDPALAAGMSLCLLFALDWSSLGYLCFR